MTFAQMITKCADIVNDTTIRVEGDPGCDEFSWQILDEAMTNIRQRKDGYSSITFDTDKMSPNDVAFHNQKHVGIVLWIPVEWIRQKEPTE